MKKVAVIGLGNIAMRHRYNLKQLYPNASVYAMSSSGRIPDEEISNCDQVVRCIADLISTKVELVIVASPASIHADHAVPLIEAGIPTLIEKPVTANSEDAKRLQKAINENNTPVVVGYCLRYLSSVKRIKELLDNDKVGKLYNAFIHIGQYLPDWRPNKDYRESVSANKNLGGGALLELSHELDYAQWLLGDLKVEHALLRSSSELGLEVEDIADIVAHSSEGVVCHIHLDFLQRSAKRYCSFIGSQGRLDWDLIQNQIMFIDSNGSKILHDEPMLDKNQIYISMVEDFVAMIEGRPHQCVEIEMASQTINLVEKIKNLANWSN